MSSYIETGVPFQELSVRSGPTFSALDLVKSRGAIRDFTLAPNILAATGSTGVVVGAYNEVGDPCTVKVGFGVGPAARHLAEKEAAFAAAAAQVTTHVPRVYETSLEQLTIETTVNGAPHKVAGTFPVTFREHVPGDNLSRKDKLDVSETVRILRPVAEALDAMHGVGIVHRDITPGNIIDRPEQGGAIIDFDNAFRRETVADSSLVGTPGYIAPEEFKNGEPITHFVDQWKLAATAYKVITGKRLIPGENAIATMNIMLDPQVYVKHVVKKLKILTPNVQRVFARALALDEHERYVTAGAFINALEKADRKDTRKPLPRVSTIFSK